jgi:hypothetical protein
LRDSSRQALPLRATSGNLRGLPTTTDNGIFMNFARRILAILAASLGLDACAGQYSDMWWNPQESGWGVNVVQQLETAFVTLYVYGADGKPTWYVAPRTTVYAYSGAGALPQFAGALYRTQGPWQGGAFDPAAVQVTPVGTLTLEVMAKNRIRVHYTAEGLSVVKEVVRQTWDTPIVATNYLATFNLRQVPIGSPPAGTLQYTGDMLVHFDGAAGFIRVDDHLGRRCEYRGAYVQAGKIGTVAGNFNCDPLAGPMLASSGTFELSDLEVSEHGVTGYLRTYGAAVNEYGRFAATRF